MISCWVRVFLVEQKNNRHKPSLSTGNMPYPKTEITALAVGKSKKAKNCANKYHVNDILENTKKYAS